MQKDRMCLHGMVIRFLMHGTQPVLSIYQSHQVNHKSWTWKNV